MSAKPPMREVRDSVERFVQEGVAALQGAEPLLVDIYETENGIVLAAELPGVGKNDIAVEVKDNILTLKGERKAGPDVKAENFYRRERCYGTFQRSFTLQQNIQPNLIKATFKDGVLHIEIPKPQEEQPKQITVNVE